MSIFSLMQSTAIQMFGFLLAIIGIGFLIFLIIKKVHSVKIAAVISLIAAGLLFLFGESLLSIKAQYPFSLKTFGPAAGPALPIKNIFKFFEKAPAMEKVSDIARDPNEVLPPISRVAPDRVKINLEAKEVIGEMADGIQFAYWTFNGAVPGPFLRVREGDTVELTLKNNLSSVDDHNIDLHAVTGPGGGAIMTNVSPGESKTMVFKALNPGLYVYHCAHPNAATHMAHGLYGLIFVEPKEGLPKVDKEFYVMQGEFYGAGALGSKGLQIFDAQKMLDAKPEYIVFNGKIKSLVQNMKANVGDKVRIFFGNGGVNLISSFHIIGEIFDTVYPESSIGGALFKNVQTTLVPAGGAAIVDFKLEVPGNYILVDHALSRLDRGAWGVLQVSGQENKEIYDGVSNSSLHGHGE